jgi:16S rRNA (uracil1498-N3)-methyltransferase
MDYFYTPREYISSSSLSITDQEAKHLAKVLRKKSGDEIYVTDGVFNLYKCKIQNINNELVNCEITEKFYNINESKIKINLYISLIKNPNRFEFAIEKAVELGVYSITPVICKNTVNKTTEKTERWQSIAIAAMKQSQRCYLPLIYSAVNFINAVNKSNSDIKLIADEKEKISQLNYIQTKELAELLNKITSIDIYIGPEGGFTLNELEEANSYGFKTINLGSRKFRTETAAIYLISKIL